LHELRDRQYVFFFFFCRCISFLQKKVSLRFSGLGQLSQFFSLLRAESIVKMLGLTQECNKEKPELKQGFYSLRATKTLRCLLPLIASNRKTCQLDARFAKNKARTRKNLKV
jgi:hypothetical protein